jgi:alkylation response protein AidB-like acyl-CoA dehydrogenase
VTFLTAERATLDEFIPGLDPSLADIAFSERETPRSPAIQLFREAGGPGLLIPRDYAGGGATALQAIRIQRAIGSRAPSLAVASCMHQFSVMTLVELSRQRKGPELFLLEAIARQRLLMASGFAEGRAGAGILDAGMRARRTDGGFIVNGSKKPCSLSRSMDLLTASVSIDAPEGSSTPVFAILLIPAKSNGISHRPFWNNPILAGAESDEVVLTDVTVSDQLAFETSNGEMDAIQTCGFVWFELLITASYLGIASALAERAIAARRGPDLDRAHLASELEGAMSALEGIAARIASAPLDSDLLGRMLLVRYATERAIERATDLAVTMLGGIAFIQSPDVSYLLAASRGLAFHPPSRSSMASGLASLLAGEPLRLP